jgi:hypothetical protein
VFRQVRMPVNEITLFFFQHPIVRRGCQKSPWPDSV